MVLLGEMLSNIAHQWRQPLNAISVLASGIKLNFELGITENNILDDLEEIINTTQFLSKTIDDFKSFIESNKEKVSINISKVINNILKMLEATFGKNHIKIITNIDKDLDILTIKGNFYQILLNILSNAKDVLIDKETKVVYLTAKKLKQYIVIEICDSGGGIKEKDLNKIFEPYFTTKKDGTGIGLYMTKKMVEDEMHGKIKVANKYFKYEEKRYFGACFSIYLPKESKSFDSKASSEARAESPE